MIKLTKPQQKHNARIYAWLRGEPFAETSRDRHPRVPELEAALVLSDFTPQYAQDYGAFFTPPDMARTALAYLAIPDDPNIRVLEPAAGIGGLVYWLRRLLPNVQVDACELVQEYQEIGQKLFPEANWLGRDAWDHLATIEGQYDFVVMNPPYGLTCGLNDARSRSMSGAKRGEHLFLELALRALKPGGQALIIAPANLITGLPKAAQKFFAAHGAAETQIPLPGKFALTNIQVDAFIVRRIAPVADYTPQPCPPITELYRDWRRACGETYTSRTDDTTAAALLVGGSNAAAGGEFRRYCRIAVAARVSEDAPQTERLRERYLAGTDAQPDNFPHALGGLPWYRWLTERTETPALVVTPTAPEAAMPAAQPAADEITTEVREAVAAMYREWHEETYGFAAPALADVAWELLNDQSGAEDGGDFRRYCRLAIHTVLVQGICPASASNPLIACRYHAGEDVTLPDEIGTCPTPWYRLLNEAATPAPPDNATASTGDYSGFTWETRAQLADLYREWRKRSGGFPTTEDCAGAWQLLTGQCRAADGAEFRRYCRIAVSTYLTQGMTPQSKALVKLAYDRGGGQDPHFPDTGGSTPWHLYLSEPEPDTAPTPPTPRPDLNTEWAALEADVAAIDGQLAVVETLLTAVTRPATPTPPTPATVENWVQTPLWQLPGLTPRSYPRGPQRRQVRLAL